jgi:hypothetical protein
MKLHLYHKKFLICPLILSTLYCFCQQVTFNNNYSVACHNCYERKLATNFQDVFTYTTTIELDIWNNNFGIGLVGNLLGKSMQHDWYVKHKPQQKGNQNCVGGSFRDCLLQINAWSRAHPLHEVITIFVDKKQNWGSNFSGRKPADLDNLLVSVFSREAIFTPADLLGDKNNLKEAAQTRWPPLDSLRGKFIFVLTDGTIFNHRYPLVEYEKAQQHKAVCFVSPLIKSEKEIEQMKGFSKEEAQDVVFYNLKEKHFLLAEKIGAINCISRVFGSMKQESYDRYEQLVKDKVNFVALYNYKIPTKAQKGQGIYFSKKNSL